jgi:tetratricopeptide (TPR) repeat protein
MDLLGRLVDKSLVVFDDSVEPPRYRYLETLQAYARERLDESGESEGMRDGHLSYFTDYAEGAEGELVGEKQLEWLGRLEAEHDNFRAAIDWSVAAGGVRRVTLGLRMATALGRFWLVRGYFGEGRARLKALLGEGSGELSGDSGEVLAEGGAVPGGVIARALRWAGTLALRQSDYGEATQVLTRARSLAKEAGDRKTEAFAVNDLGVVAWNQSDYARAQALHEEALAIQREIGDKRGIAASLNNLGNVAGAQGDYVRAQALHEEALAIQREIGDKWGIAISLNNLGGVAWNQSDYARAQALYEQALAIWREIGDKWGIAGSLNNLGLVAYEQGDYVRAQGLYEEALAIWREIGDKWGIAISLSNLGLVAYEQGDYVRAQGLHEQALAIRREIGDRQGIAKSLEGLALVAVGQACTAEARLQPTRAAGEETPASVPSISSAESTFSGEIPQGGRERTGDLWRRAVVLFAAARALRGAMGTPAPPVDQRRYDSALAKCREALGEEGYARAFAEGAALSLEEALQVAGGGGLRR